MNTQQKPIVSGNGAAIRLEKILDEQKKQRQTPVEITRDDYRQAVETLVDLALTGCGSARAAAQVLLSLYNGANWHVNLIDLCLLDPTNYRAAIIAIRGRCEFNREPQLMIIGGEKIFDQLENEWENYHVKNRYQNIYR